MPSARKSGNPDDALIGRLLRDDYERLLTRVVPWAALLLGALFFLNTALYFLYVNAQWSSTATQMSAVSGGIYLVIAGLGFLRRISNVWYEHIAGAAALLIPLTTHLYLLEHPYFATTIYLAIYIVGVSAFLLSPYWVTAYALASYGGFLFIVAHFDAWTTTVPYHVALTQACAIAALVWWSRKSRYQYVHQLLVRNQALTDELARALRLTRARLQRIAENLPDIVFRVSFLNGDWHVDFISKAVREILGYGADELTGNKPLLKRLTAKAEVDFMSRQGASRLIEGPLVLESESKAGEPVWLELRTAPVIVDGMLRGIEGVARDITRQHLSEQALILEKNRAEAANRVKTSIVANMSHEIRTPMTAILGYVGLLRERVENPAHVKSLTTVESAAKRLLHLLNSIIDLARLEADQMPIYPAPHHVASSLENVAGTLAVLAQEKSLDFTWSADPDLVTATDAYREEQLLTNIIGNAIKFTEKGGVEVKAFAQELDGVKRAVIVVNDTGPGIGTDFLPFAFDDFRQESEGLDRRYEGSGLGLAIGKRLTERMGGTITIDSHPGQGTTVTLSFPLESLPQVVAVQGEQAVMAAPAVLPGPLLVVEDDEATAALYAEILGPLAVVVGAPEEALRLAGQNRYAVAIIDINLGLAGINGRQLQQQLRQVPTMAETKFVAVTAFAMKGDEEKLIADGFDAYLAKPFTADELAWVLARQVNPPRVDQ